MIPSHKPTSGRGPACRSCRFSPLSGCFESFQRAITINSRCDRPRRLIDTRHAGQAVADHLRTLRFGVSAPCPGTQADGPLPALRCVTGEGPTPERRPIARAHARRSHPVPVRQCLPHHADRPAGAEQQATLWGTVEALAYGRITPIALVAGLSIIFAPGLQIILLAWVLVYARDGQIAPGFRACMRALEHLRPWSMLEVCLLGILVAIIKLGGMLDAHPGIGLWAMAILTILILLIAGRDVRGLWDDMGVEPR